MESTPSREAARQLHDWFDSVSRLTEGSLFGIAPEGPHRDAVVLDLLTRNGRILRGSEIDREGKLYSPLCVFLAAACRRLRTSLGVGHWQAAVDNLVTLHEQARNFGAELKTLGLVIGTPAGLFKQSLDEAILQTGLTAPSYLDRENREIALGLAINWGIRFLPAYGLECDRLTAEAGRRDLAWVAGLVASLPSTVSRNASK